ncbi:MAG TPA: hypothetical protein VHG53_04110 [Candidatus Limnocylindria bacterium]|nr:hypothetical protein [Candidatus Limnocylindria bacterium]
MTTEARAIGISDPSTVTAYRLLWLAVILDVLAFGVGFGWDRRWHATHPVEDFFSPPHLSIYSMHFLATLTLMAITFDGRWRRQFGPAFRLWPFPFPEPGAIAIAGAGFATTALAGVFDAIWHTRFGLDETAWSFPHSMLGWGIFVAFVGIVACRIAVARERPIGWASALVLGFLLLGSSIERIPGPFLNNISTGVLELIRAVPVLAASAPFQHIVRTYEAWNITRLNGLFMPLAAIGAGLGIRLLQRFDPHPVVLIVLTAIVSYNAQWVPYVVPGAIVAWATADRELALARCGGLRVRRRDRIPQPRDREGRDRATALQRIVRDAGLRGRRLRRRQGLDGGERSHARTRPHVRDRRRNLHTCGHRRARPLRTRADAVVPNRTAFLRAITKAVSADLEDSAAPHELLMHSMLKLWFGNKDLHYECGVYERRRVVELGLHFESAPLTNLQLLGAFRARAKTIARRLPNARVEDWDRGWARVWEPIELRPLDARFQKELAGVLVRYVRVLEPILEDELPADVRWSR